MAVQTVFRRYEGKYLLAMAQKETVFRAMHFVGGCVFR